MNDTALLLRDSLARVLSDVMTKSCREAADRGDWQALWQTLDELGLPRLLVAESQGGSGAGAPEAFAVIELLGRFAVPCPIAETIITAGLLSRHGLPVPTGVLTLAPLDNGASLRLQQAASGWRLSGTLQGVPWGQRAQAILAPAQAGAETMLCLITTDEHELQWSGNDNLAGEPRDDIVFDHLPLADRHVVRLADEQMPWRCGALLRSVQISGALGGALTMSVDYVRQRIQFGRPLAKFQAIQQQLATLASETTAAGSAARRAFMSWDDPTALAEIAGAKIYAGRAASLGAAISHQVHGAIGFTREYELQHLTRRLWAWREEFGNESWWAERLGRHIAAAGADALWLQLAADRY